MLTRGEIQHFVVGCATLDAGDGFDVVAKCS